MSRKIITMALCAMAVLSACSRTIPPYQGPQVTSILVKKQDRRLYVFHGDKVLKSYKIALGFTPVGDKQVEGDGKTPEGAYVIDRKNPKSQFHLSLGVSYPNARDIAEAKALGKKPGGDIFVHGQATPRRPAKDWTAGCIAVQNYEIEELYQMVGVGTPIFIQP